MTTLWADLSAPTQAAIEREAPWVARYLQVETIAPGLHNPSRAMVWAVYWREYRDGIGKSRAVRNTAAELGMHAAAVWRIIGSINAGR